MTWSVDTGAKYHTQDTSYYCGAACAMMVLAEIGVSYASMNQDDLYTSNHSNNVKPGWYTDPYGLRYTMVDRKPASFTNTFVVYKPETEAEGTRKVVYTLWHYRVSPITLVYGCGHWIVVRGVQTDVEPTSGTAYTVNGLWVNNPVWEDNDPHSGTDVCGSGGVNGIENQWISYADWQSTYFTGCNYDSGTGASQYISVCDPDVPEIELPRRPKIDRQLDGREIVDPGQAEELIRRGMELHGLFESERMGRLRDAPFGRPVLVKRLDRLDSYYYLAPAGSDDEVLGFAQIDGRFGDLQSVFVLEESARMYERRPKAIVEELLERRIELDEEKGRLRLRREALCVCPFMVWKPCRESYSPHLPFWQVNSGSETLYIRADGKVYTQLRDPQVGA